jgi:hypothetical protein
MFVAFYDKKTNRLLEVEKVDMSIQDARLASTHLAMLWQSGRHSLPSPIWCVWDNNQIEDGWPLFSIFSLNDQYPSQVLCDRIHAIAKVWN